MQKIRVKAGAFVHPVHFVHPMDLMDKMDEMDPFNRHVANALGSWKY